MDSLCKLEKVKEPILTRDLEILLEDLQRDGELEIRGLIFLYSVFEITPFEIENF